MPPRCAICNKFYFPVEKGCQNVSCSGYGMVLSGTPPSSEKRKVKIPQPVTTGTVGKVVPKPVTKQPATAKPPLSGLGAKVQSHTPPPATVAKSQPKKETWRERDARIARERLEKEEQAKQALKTFVEDVDKRYPPIIITEGKNKFFRACGKGQEPWDLLETRGFVHRSGRKSAAEIKKYLAGIYSKAHGGAKTYMANYRTNPAANPAHAPFISAGKKGNDAQGASNAFWQYAMEISGLKEIKVTADLLNVKPDTLSDDVSGVRLMINGDDFDSATMWVLLHGPLPECTWLGGTTEGCIKAWTRLGGPPWQRKWRTFSRAVVIGVKELAAEYGIDISQPG